MEKLSTFNVEIELQDSYSMIIKRTHWYSSPTYCSVLADPTGETSAEMSVTNRFLWGKELTAEQVKGADRFCLSDFEHLFYIIQRKLA